MILKYLIPFHSFTLDSPLSSVEARARIEKAMAPRKLFRLSRPESELEGEMTSRGFQVNRVPQGRNSFNAIATGHIEPAPSGCRIRVSLRMHIAVIIFCCIWLSFVLNVAGVFAVTSDPAASGPHWAFGLIPIGMAVFMVTLVNGGFWWSANLLKVQLNDLFEARTAPAYSPTVR